MIAKPPHFLLYSESTRSPREDAVAESNKRRPEEQQSWHFLIRSSDGKTQLEVSDEEQGLDSQERVELLALVRGLEALEQPSRVTLVTPSAVVRRGLRFGLEHWRDNGWQWERFGRMTPIKNADLWQRVDRALRFHDLHCHLLQHKPAADDLKRPVPDFLARHAPSALPELGGEFTSHQDNDRQPENRPFSATTSPIPSRQRSWSFRRILSRLLRWFGLYHSDRSLVIAAH